MSGKAACVFSAGETMQPQLIKGFAAAASCAFENFGTGSEGSCNTELISAEQVSNAGNWELF